MTNKRANFCFLILCFVLLMTRTIYAQEPAATTEEVTTDEEGPSPTGEVSLDFRDADIRNVFKILAYKSGVNIVASPEVQGTVTIQLNNVPWKQALDVILSTYGYAYEQRGNIILVTTVENLKQRREDAMLLAEQEPLTTRTFTLNFSKASEIIVSLEKLKSARGSIDFDERTNTLIVTDTLEKLEYIEGVVRKLDRTTHQVLIEAKIVETTFTNTEKLGVDWVTKASVSGSSRQITYPFKIGGTENDFAGNTPVPTTTNFSFGTLDFSTTQAVFELLINNSDTNILSNPRIVTLDNQAAQIVVGTQYPLPNYTYNEEQAALQVNGFEYLDIGIIFDVIPHVNDAGFITLEVEPKITAIQALVTVENTQVPQLSTESAKTKVMIKDGDTLVIAGLIKDQTVDTKTRIPVISRVPLLGEAFKKKDLTKTKQDIIIFITPHIVTPDVPDIATSSSKSL